MITSPTATFSVAGVNLKSETVTLHVAAKLPDMLLSRTAVIRSIFFMRLALAEHLDLAKDKFVTRRLLKSTRRVCLLQAANLASVQAPSRQSSLSIGLQLLLKLTQNVAQLRHIDRFS